MTPQRLGFNQSSGLGAILLAFFLACNLLKSEQVSFSGIVRADSWNFNNTVSNHTERQVTVQLDGQLWKIRTTFTNDYFEEYSYDGTNCYGVLYTPQILGNRAKPLRPGETLMAPGLVRNGVMLIDGYWSTRICWFAFASAEFLNGRTNVQMTVPWASGRSPGVDSFYLKMHSYLLESGLPSGGTFCASTELWKKEHERLKQLPDTFLMPDGYEGAKYSVLTNITLNGKSYPKRFLLERWGPPVPNRQKGWLMEKIEGSFELISAQSQVFLSHPEIKAEVGVQDFRYATNSMPFLRITYVITNTQWPRGDEDWMLQLRSKAIEAYPQYERMLAGAKFNPTGLAVSRLLIFVMFSLPIIFVLLRKWRTYSKQNQIDRKV